MTSPINKLLPNAHFSTTSCTLDRATIYDDEEFAAHNSSLAGQLYTEDEQCELLRGDGARFCSVRYMHMISCMTVCRYFCPVVIVSLWHLSKTMPL